jgi:large subunit ribosomal protein L25
MAHIATLQVESRKGLGTRAARKLREQGIVPGNVFGHKQDPEPIQVTSEALRACLHTGARVVDLTLHGKPEKALVSEVQWDTFGRHILHVDLLRVDANERVTVKVPVHTRGTAPGALAGGLMEITHHELTVECLAIEIPNELIVRVGHMQIGDTVHVKDLTDVPAGVKIIEPPDTIVLHVVQPRIIEEVAPAGEAGPQEPELIGKKPAEEEAAAE